MASEFLQLDFVSREQEQHSESQLPKCFKAFANGHPTKAARADQHAESEEQNYLRNQSSRHRSRENRCCDGAQSDPENDAAVPAMATTSVLRLQPLVAAVPVSKPMRSSLSARPDRRP